VENQVGGIFGECWTAGKNERQTEYTLTFHDAPFMLDTDPDPNVEYRMFNIKGLEN